MGVLSSYKNKWLLIVLIMLPFYRMGEISYYLFRLNFGAPDGLFGVGKLIAKPYYSLIGVYLFLVVLIIFFLKRIDKRKTILISLIIIMIVFMYWIEPLIEKGVMNYYINTIDLNIEK